jgi:iterative type I PKS product template protein
LDKKALTGTIIIQSDLTHPKMLPVVTGHVVNDRILTPGLVYAEIAMTVANYLWRTLVSIDQSVGLNVCEFDVHKPLMVDPYAEGGQHIQVECSARIDEGIMDVLVRSVTPDGEILMDIGKGIIKFEDRNEWQQEWSRQKYLVQGQVDWLRHRYDTGKAHKILTGMAYKLFQNLLEYSPTYQGMREIVLDVDDTIAFARIKLRYIPGVDGDFFISPFAMDNLSHLSGFVCNASDVTSAEPMVFISHGWESLKFLAPEEVTPEKEYLTFVKMKLGDKNISSGDVYVFEEESMEIIAVLYGVKFQGIPRRLMDVLLPPKKVMFVKTK